MHAASGNYLNHVRVTIEGTGRDTTTDENGHFRFDGVAAGPVRLAAFFTGLESASLTLNRAPRGRRARGFGVVANRRERAAQRW
jgi:hypothetical protein